MYRDLIFKNEVTGVYLEVGPGTPYIINKIDWGNPTVSIRANQWKIGTDPYEQKLGARTVQIRGYVIGSSSKDITDKCRTLANHVRPFQKIHLIYGNKSTTYRDISAYLDCYTTDSIAWGIEYKENNSAFKLFTMKLYCASPYFHQPMKWSDDTLNLTYMDCFSEMPTTPVRTELGHTYYDGRAGITSRVDFYYSNIGKDPEGEVKFTLYNGGTYCWIGHIDFWDGTNTLLGYVDIPNRHLWTLGLIEIDCNNYTMYDTNDTVKTNYLSNFVDYGNGGMALKPGENVRKMTLSLYSAQTGSTRVYPSLVLGRIQGSLGFSTM